jgi:hypothetical protein
MEDRRFTRAIHAVESYLRIFFSEMKELDSSKSAKQLAEECKKELETSQAMTDAITSHIFQDEYCISGILKVSQEKGYWMDKVYYLPREYSILFIDDENQELVGVYESQPQSHGYAWLNQAIILLAGLAYENQQSLLEDDYIKIAQLFQAVLSFGALFQSMNPDDELLDEYANTSIDILEDPVVKRMPEWLSKLMDDFETDLKEGKLEYVQEAHRALVLTAPYRKSNFEFDDYYVSNKSTSRRDVRYKGINQSILASMFEERHHEDEPEVVEAERIIGYVNHYNTDHGNQSREDTVSKEIRNPGKFKPRLIMYSDNEIQDLCCYIKNRYKAVLREMPSSCTEKQERGCEFGLRITNPHLIAQNHHNVFCWDWEDATNNVAWDFDLRCFKIVFPQLESLWHFLCKMKKHHRYASKGKASRTYTQMGKGQPQGLGGSFDDMDWFHQVIIMLVMKMTGRENLKLSQVLRDLGDDDLSSTVTEDPICKEDPLYQDKPGWRTEFELAFRKVNDGVNLRINDSKCIFNEYNPNVNAENHYEAEFAKVRIRDGKFASPLPPRIAAKYYQPAYQLIALNWEMQHGWTSKEYIDVILSREFSQEELILAEILYKSGCVRSSVFDNYTDNTLVIDKRLKAVVKASYFVSCMKTGAIFSLIPDGKREFGCTYQKELDSFKQLISKPELEQAWMDIEDPDHKVNQLLMKNEDLVSTIANLYGFDEKLAKFGNLLLVTDDRIANGFRKAAQLMNFLPYWKNDTEDYFIPEAILNLDCSDIVKACDVMLFKSSRKRGSQELKISHKATQEALRIIRTFLPSCEELLNQMVQDKLDPYPL